MRIWRRSGRRKGKVPENAVVRASSSDGESTQSHALCSGQSEAETATTSASCPSSSPYFSARIQSLSERRNDFDSELEFEVEASKSHWTEASVATSDCDSKEEQLTNSVVFEKLKEHPQWGPFLRRRPYKLEIGKKIAEGGQAEIFAATATNETDCCRDGSSKPEPRWHREGDLVVKVFKDGFPLQDLQKWWPPGFASAASLNRHFYGNLSNTYGLCWAQGAVLLEDGRFAFIFPKYWGDLRKRIDDRMLKSNGTPPFSLLETNGIMLNIARGMAILHGFGLLHRDLKAANVLVLRGTSISTIIADFESSVGIAGTGFWRAPEVLLALRNGGWEAVKCTRESDVYSYAMTCYEVITGQQPFEVEGHSQNDYDVVLRGERPALPDKIPPEWKALVTKCWHQDPLQRPSFQEIVVNVNVKQQQLYMEMARVVEMERAAMVQGQHVVKWCSGWFFS